LRVYQNRADEAHFVGGHAPPISGFSFPPLYFKSLQPSSHLPRQNSKISTFGDDLKVASMTERSASIEISENRRNLLIIADYKKVVENY
jgi:hypothetical protein